MDDHNKSNNDCNYQTRNTLILCHNINIQSSMWHGFLLRTSSCKDAFQEPRWLESRLWRDNNIPPASFKVEAKSTNHSFFRLEIHSSPGSKARETTSRHTSWRSSLAGTREGPRLRLQDTFKDLVLGIEPFLLDCSFHILTLWPTSPLPPRTTRAHTHTRSKV